MFCSTEDDIYAADEDVKKRIDSTEDGILKRIARDGMACMIEGVESERPIVGPEQQICIIRKR